MYYRMYWWAIALCTLGCARGQEQETVLPAADSRSVEGPNDARMNPQGMTSSDFGQIPFDAEASSDQTIPSDAGNGTQAENGSRADATSISPDEGLPTERTLPERLQVRSVEVVAGVAQGFTNWRIWGRGNLGVSPIFSVPLSDCRTLVGFTTRDNDGTFVSRAVRLDAQDAIEARFELARGFWLRGLAAEPDGHFGALLWNDPADTIQITRYSAVGEASWTTELVNADNRPDDFEIGDSRLEYGAGRYGAYYHVHSNSGHEGDTLKWVDANTGQSQTGWAWGCSHSMSNLLRFHPTVEAFLPVCVTDCFPGTSGDFGTESQGGIYINHRGPKVMDVDAGCNGSVAGELGGAAVGPTGWALVFNAHQAPLTLGQSGYDRNVKNQDIGFSSIGANRQPGPVIWLTNTAVDEADATIAAWAPTNGHSEEYIVGWSEQGGHHQIARIDGQGTLLEGPHDISDRARWGRRDDPFRRHNNGDVIWAWFDRPGQTTMNIGRLRSDRMCP